MPFCNKIKCSLFGLQETVLFTFYIMFTFRNWPTEFILYYEHYKRVSEKNKGVKMLYKVVYNKIVTVNKTDGCNMGEVMV